MNVHREHETLFKLRQVLLEGKQPKLKLILSVPLYKFAIVSSANSGSEGSLLSTVIQHQKTMTYKQQEKALHCLHGFTNAALISIVKTVCC